MHVRTSDSSRQRVGAPAAGERSALALRATGRGFNKIFGFGLSMLLLAVASLIAIPSMVASSGPAAWGMIAAGQAVGAVASAVVAYGWGISGPAKIARSDFSERLTEYGESVVCELLIFIPVAAAAIGLACLIGRGYELYAAAGALSTSATGLTANWYFIGRVQPYRLLVGETLPRIAGTMVGIVSMWTGSDAIVGVLWQLGGMVAAFLVCTLWILRPWNAAYRHAVHRRPVRTVLWAQRHGLVATLVNALYNAAPITIVTLVAPGIQPVYAVVDKVQRQITVGLGPFTTVMQGWIPRAPAGRLIKRVREALLISGACSAGLALFILLIARDLMEWLGGGRIQPSLVALVLMAVFIGTFLFENIVARAALPALHRLGRVARASVIGMTVGLPLVAIGASLIGTEGALAAILIGLCVRLAIELLAVRQAGNEQTAGIGGIEGPMPLGIDV